MIGTIVGKEVRKYMKGEEVKTARTLFVVWEKPKNPEDGLTGQRCEALYIPFEIPQGVDINSRCDFVYQIYSGRNGPMARLVDIIPIKN